MTRGIYTIPTTVEPCSALHLPKTFLLQARRQSQVHRMRQVRRLFLIRLHRRLKPKKPYGVKVKKSKKKYKVTWKKKSKKYQTIISYRYGKRKWKKKTIKKNTATTIKKSKKRLQIRLRCKIKNQSKWIYSAYTKTFSFRP